MFLYKIRKNREEGNNNGGQSLRERFLFLLKFKFTLIIFTFLKFFRDLRAKLPKPYKKIEGGGGILNLWRLGEPFLNSNNLYNTSYRNFLKYFLH